MLNTSGYAAQQSCNVRQLYLISLLDLQEANQTVIYPVDKDTDIAASQGERKKREECTSTVFSDYLLFQYCTLDQEFKYQHNFIQPKGQCRS